MSPNCKKSRPKKILGTGGVNIEQMLQVLWVAKISHINCIVLLLFSLKMISAIDKNCTFLISNEKSTGASQEDICKDLESSDVNSKIRLVTILTINCILNYVLQRN